MGRVSVDVMNQRDFAVMNVKSESCSNSYGRWSYSEEWMYIWRNFCIEVLISSVLHSLLSVFLNFFFLFVCLFDFSIVSFKTKRHRKQRVKNK